jgi:hypothetical protein
MAIFSENTAHRTTLVSLEATKQAQIAAAAGNAGQIKTAEVAYFRGARASAIANNCSPSQFTNALRELGILGS